MHLSMLSKHFRPEEDYSSSWKLVYNSTRCFVPEITSSLQDSFTSSSSDDSSASKTNPDIQKKLNRTVQQENVLVKKEREFTPIKKSDWRDNLILKKGKGVLPELGDFTASPLGPTITSHCGSSSPTCFFPTISPNLINFCTCNTF